MCVEEILKTKGSSVITIDEDALLSDAARLMTARNVGALVVLARGGRLYGVISERAIVSALAEWRDARNMLVQDVMATGGPTVTPASTVVDLMKLMTRNAFATCR